MCMHFFPAHSEKQSEPFYKVLSRPVTKQPYCTAQNHVGMGWGSKTKVSCAVSRKCFSVSRCFTQRPSKTSPPRPPWAPPCAARCSTLHNTFARLLRRTLDSTVPSNLCSTPDTDLVKLHHGTCGQHPAQHPAQHQEQHPAEHPA